MSPDLISPLYSWSMAAITLLSGCLIAATPWLVRRREAFAVTVPEAAQRDPRLRRLRRAYLAATLAVTVLCSLLIPAVSADPIALSIMVCLPVAAGYALMLAFRSRVRAIKRKAGWHARKSGSAAVAGNADANAPRALPLAWSLLYLPIICATIALALAVYPLMPPEVPVHMNAAGQIDQWMEKGWKVVLAPAAIQLFAALCLAASHLMILKSKRPTSTETPVASAIAYGMFARAQSVALLVTGCLVVAVIALMPLTFARIVSMQAASAAIIVVCVAVIALQLALSAVFGQSGSRLLRRMDPAGALDYDDDANWRAGVFYADPTDPAIVVPKRFGIGWSLNYANPRSWIALAAFVALTVVFIAVISHTVG